MLPFLWFGHFHKSAVCNVGDSVQWAFLWGREEKRELKPTYTRSSMVRRELRHPWSDPLTAKGGKWYKVGGQDTCFSDGMCFLKVAWERNGKAEHPAYLDPLTVLFTAWSLEACGPWPSSRSSTRELVGTGDFSSCTPDPLTCNHILTHRICRPVWGTCEALCLAYSYFLLSALGMTTWLILILASQWKKPSYIAHPWEILSCVEGVL